MAADLTPIMPAVTPAPAPPPAPSFNWAGLTIGIDGAYHNCGICLYWGTALGEVGYNWVNGSLLYGVQLGAGAFIGPIPPVAPVVSLDARVGYILGNALLYAEGGGGKYFGGGDFYLGAAGGVELAVGQAMSVYAEAGADKFFGGPWVWNVGGGLRFHPGN